MSHNTFGHLFRFTTWGESHGPSIGVVVDGCPPGIADQRRDDPARSRPAEARPVALHHAAPRGRCREDPERHVRGRARRAAQDHRHADLAADREHRPALEGLFRDQGQVPPRPRRFHLPPEVRHPRLQGLGPRLGARDRVARCRRRRRPPGHPAGEDPRAASSRWGRTRSTTPTSIGPRSTTIRSSAPTPRPPPPGSPTSTASARPAPRSARSSRSWPKACRPAGARRSTASSRPTSPRR